MTYLVATSPIAPGLEEIVPGFCWASTRPTPVPNRERLHVFFSGDLVNLTQLRQRFRQPDATAEELVAHLLTEDGNLDAARGEFAVVSVDASERRIRGFTDRSCVGELNYIHRGGRLILSPDLERVLPFSDRSLDPDSVARFFALGRVDRRETLLADIRRISHFYTMTFDGTLEIRGDYLSHLGQIPIDRNMTEARALDTMAQSLGDFLAQLGSLERPIYNSLSGGVDSSLLQVLLGAQGHNRSFSITFEGFGNDNRYAQDVVEVLGTKHTALAFNQREFLPYVRRGVELTGRPFINQGEAIFQRVYEKMAECDSHVIATSGQTADAGIGAGVPRSLMIAARAAYLPASLMRLVTRGVTYSRDLVLAVRREKLSRELLAATESNPSEVDRAFQYLGFRGDLFRTSLELSQGFSGSPLEVLSRIHLLQGEWKTLPSVWHSLAAAHGVTLKFPFADPRFVEFLLTVPLELKARRFQTKYLGKKLLARNLPRRCVYRPKLQLEVPFDAIFRTEPTGAEVLDELRAAAYFQFDVDQMLANREYALLLRLVNFHFWTVDVLEAAGARQSP